MVDFYNVHAALHAEACLRNVLRAVGIGAAGFRSLWNRQLGKSLVAAGLAFVHRQQTFLADKHAEDVPTVSTSPTEDSRPATPSSRQDPGLHR